jgi:hypothetical protein
LNFGFNTDVKVAGVVYHVQTEDRGESNPVIDTTVYCKGRIVHRRATSYKDELDQLRSAPERLHQKLEAQHRAILEELRGGVLKFESPAAPAEPSAAKGRAAKAGGIQVQLLNPASWLEKGTATLKLEVKARGSGAPVEAAEVRVTVEGGAGPLQFSSKTGRDGKAELAFPLPRIGGGGMELQIRAIAPAGRDELRYSLKPRTPGP